MSSPRRDGASDLPYEIRRSHIQGRGAFATRRIRAGARIVEYLGERITREEADARYDDAAMERHHTFLFAVDDETVIDAAHGGNSARYINHSCEPNCHAVIEDGRVFIEAVKNIQPGTELTYDYAYERNDDHDEESERLYACHCGTPSCRGTILAPRKESTKARTKARTKAATKRTNKTKRSKRSRRPQRPTRARAKARGAT